MNKKDLLDFLEFRKKFTQREWADINQAVALRLQRKADKLQLDGSDVDAIVKNHKLI